MIKKLLILKVVLTLLIFSTSISAALHWNVAAFAAVGTAVLVTAASLAAAPAIVLGGILSVGFHVGVIGLYWDDISGAPTMSDGEPASKGVSVIIDPNTPFVLPDGYTADEDPQNEPHPPEVGVLYNVFQSANYNKSNESAEKRSFVARGPNATYQDVLNQISEYSTFELSHISLNYTQGNHMVYGKYSDDPQDKPYDRLMNVSKDCDAGYSLNPTQTECQLVNEENSRKPTDDVCEIRQQNGIYRASQNDPDCENTTIEGEGTNAIQAVAPKKGVYIVTASDGRTSVYTKTYDTALNQTTTVTANLDSDQNVTLISQTVSIGDSTALSPVTGGGGTGGGGEGAAQDSSLNVKDGGDEDVGLDNLDGGTDEAYEGVDTIFDDLKQWTVPIEVGTCPDTSFTLFDEDYNFDAMCTIFQESAPMIQTAMTVVYTLAALFIVLGA